MSRYSKLFERLNAANQGAFVPFVAIGDPTPQLSEQIIEALIAGGADALELGIPFSDPVADGPTIQDAATRALKAHTTPAICFEILTRIRAKYPICQSVCCCMPIWSTPTPLRISSVKPKQLG